VTRRRGTTVEVLDYEKLTAACIEHGLRPLSFTGNALLRRLDGGAAVVVSYEGVVSTKITMGKVYLDTQNYDWECLPIEAVEACRTGESIDLADHIRTFGSRLDVNHLLLVEWAEGETR
jgi:hypothetical protein